MSEQNPIPEQLSALADGELSRDELRFVLRGMAGDAGLRGRWERWHVTRLVLNRQATLLLKPGFADTVMRAIEAEPMRTARGGWLRIAGGLAIAAGVAAVALTVVAPQRTGPAGPATLANETSLRADDLAPRLPAQPASGRALLAPPVSPIPIDPQVETYLLRHAAVPAASARSGFLPYVYVVASPANAPQPQADDAQAPNP
jgi:sigma-E factor negative regulatory protein RseA